MKSKDNTTPRECTRALINQINKYFGFTAVTRGREVELTIKALIRRHRWNEHNLN